MVITLLRTVLIIFENFFQGQESFKKQEKTPKTPKGPSSVEDIKAKMQASIEKGGSLPKVEAKFINYVKNGLDD